jgi:uncharacterized protein RhaS with RHS repeats
MYDEANVSVERLSRGGRVRYVHGVGIDRPIAEHDPSAVVKFYLSDHLGSIVRVTSAAGTVTHVREYDVWGNASQGSATSGYAYTGREWDSETGLCYYRARCYDPRSGGSSARIQPAMSMALTSTSMPELTR